MWSKFTLMGRNTDYFPYFFDELTKKYWRNAAQKVGLKVPAKIAQWDG
jgi:hypothetical protein